MYTFKILVSLVAVVMAAYAAVTADNVVFTGSSANKAVDDPTQADGLLVQKERSSCFSDSQEFSLTYFEQEDKLRLCVIEVERDSSITSITSPSTSLSLPLLSSSSDLTHTMLDKELISTAAVATDLVVLVHPSLSDAAVNISACLPSEASHGQCNFRSAVALCASHLSAEDRNCTIVMSPSDEVLLDAAFGPMPTVSNGAGAFSVEGKGSSFSPAPGSAPIQLLHVTASSSSELRLFLTDCKVTNFGNMSMDGGAIFVGRVAHSRIENCIFYNNQAKLGGAVHFWNSNSDVTIVDCLFHDNHASENGGGLYIDSFNDAFVLDNVSFSNHTAFHGGGLYINNENTNFLLVDCLFDLNVVTGIGGGMYLYSNSVNFIMKYCEFTRNSALGFYAGGLYLYSRNQVSTCTTVTELMASCDT